jgi:hypothetical protein
MKMTRVLILSAVFFTASVNVFGESIKLARTAVEFDFKDDGYYTTIPHIALQGDIFYISDNLKHRVLAYRLQDNKLEFLWAVGRPGQGPGDLMRPTEISASVDKLAVYDEHGISFFGPDGGFKSRFRGDSGEMGIGAEFYPTRGQGRTPLPDLSAGSRG